MVAEALTAREANLVLMLTPDRRIDRRILLEADSLESAGWKVTIVAMPLDQPIADDPRVVRIGTSAARATRENLVLDAYRWLRGHLPMNNGLMRLLKRLAWRYLVDQESFYSRLFAATVWRYFPAIVVAHDLPMLPMAKQLAEQRGAKLVYDSHELYSEQEFSSREKRRWGAIEARCIGACDLVITVNQSIASELQCRYGVADVSVVLNAERSQQPPLASRRFHELLGLNSSCKVLLLQGGLSAGRNLEALVDAMALVQNPLVVLVVLGDGLLLQELQRRAKANRVHFLAAVPQPELLAWTAAADGGVVPYQATCLNNYLCTPNKLFEFIACGVPILGSDLPEIGKLITGRQVGLVGPMDTAEKMANLIDNFFSDAGRLDAWRRNLVRARRELCWEVEGAKLVELYRALA